MGGALKNFGIERLTVEEKISLVEKNWDSIAEAIPLTEAQRLELDRRVRDHQANPGDVVSWEVIKATIKTRVSRG